MAACKFAMQCKFACKFQHIGKGDEQDYLSMMHKLTTDQAVGKEMKQLDAGK